MTNAADKKVGPQSELESVQVSNMVMAATLGLFLEDRHGVCVHIPMNPNFPEMGKLQFLVYNANMTMNIEPSKTNMVHGQTFTLNKPTLN